jgi:hypothetical protein
MLPGILKKVRNISRIVPDICLIACCIRWRRDVCYFHILLFVAESDGTLQVTSYKGMSLSPPDPSTINNPLSKKAHEIGIVSWFFKSHALPEWKKTGSFLWIHGKRMTFNLSARNS